MRQLSVRPASLARVKSPSSIFRINNFSKGKFLRSVLYLLIFLLTSLLIFASTGISSRAGQQLVFITADVADQETLTRDIEKNILVYRLNSKQSAIQQISEILRTYQGLEAVHLISHGRPGALHLGSEKLDWSNLPEHTDALRQWGRSLRVGGSFLLYGCEVAKGRTGAGFIQKMAAVLQTQVAASVDITGAERLGGNWILEYQTAAINANALDLAGYNSLLQTTPPDGVYKFANAATNADGTATTSEGFFLISGKNGVPGNATQESVSADEFGVYMRDSRTTTTGTSYLEVKVKNGGSFKITGSLVGEYDYYNTSTPALHNDFYNVYAVGYAGATEVARTPVHNSVGVYQVNYNLNFSTFANKQIDVFRVYYSWNVGTAQDYFNLVNLTISGASVTPPPPPATISTNANLSNLTLSSGTLNPVFAASTTSYTASVSNATSVITVTPTVAESNATVTVNNTSVTSGSVSGPISLAVGSNTITVKVTAQDGVTTNTYTIIVTRAAAPGVLLSSSPTITFSNSTGFGDNIAEDGEGGSTAISDFNIQVMPINSSGAKLTADPLQFHSGAEASWSGYPPIITYGANNPHYGWSIKSDNGAEFSLVSLDFFDWGNWDGATFVAQAFRDGSSLGTVTFTGNTNGNMVGLTNAAQLTSIFRNVDEVRVYQQGGVNSYIALNNIRVTTPSVSLPTVTSINTASANPTAATSVNYTVTFSASVSGVSASNFSLSGTASNASISAVSGSGTTWTVSVNTGSVDGALKLSLANATGISPGIGTALPYSGQQYTIDKTSPTVAITSNQSQLKAGETATITFTFSEDPAATFTNADIVVSGGTLGAITGSGTTRTAVFTPMANVNGGTASITVAAGSYSDAAGNNGGGGLSPVLSFDTQAPTVTSITRADANPTAATSVSFTVSFSEAVTGLDASDFTITTTSGNAAGTVASVTGGGTTYTVTVDNITGAGGLRLDLNNSGTGITDTYGNAVSGGYTSGQSYTIGFGPATISFSALPVKTYGDADLAPGATSTNSATTITYTSSNTLVATIVSGKIHIVGAGTAIITASQPAGNGYSAATDVQQTLTVNPATLTITANNQSKVYGSVNPAFTASYNGFVNGDNASSLTTQPTFTTTATTSSSAGNYAITVSGAVSFKYIISYVAGNLTVTPAALTITANDQTKTYGAGVPALTASYSGFVNGDNPSNLTVQPIVTTIATTTSMVGNYTILVGGAASSNYTINYVSGSLTIVPAPLTITATNVTKTYGQTLTGGTGSVAFIPNGLMNGETIGSVTIAYGTGASATDAVGTYTNQVTPGAATGGTFNPANYSITYAKANIIVGAAASIITFAALPAKTYGDADFAPGANSTNGVISITYTSSNTSVATIVSGKIHIVGAGTTTITALQAADANHSAANDQQQTLTVNKAALTAIADPQTKVYGQANPVLTVHYSGFVGSDDASKLTTQATAGTTALTDSPVGAYTITVSGGTADNYTINSYQTSSLTITPAALTITANNRSKVYGADVPALTASYSGFVNGDNASSLATAPTLSTTATAASAVGDYTITPSGAVASNYAISYATGTLSVTPATLTITADDKTKVYGLAVPALTASYSGFVNGDDASGLTTQPVLATLATISSGVGTYAITASGAVASNYTISYVSGTMTVSAAQPVITFGSLPVKTYGDTDFDAGATSDNASTPVMYSSDNTAVATIVNGKVHVVGAGTANITASQASDANHTAATDVIRQLTVNKATITITADAKNKTYGESDPALSYQITSGALVGNDNFTGSLVRDAGEDAGNYLINQGGLALNGNYTLTYNSADLTINKAAITVTAAAKTKTYGQSDPVLTYHVSSGALVGTDTFTGSLTRDPGENAGNYAIRQGTLALDANYILTYTGASLIVNKASLTITAEDKTKTYGENNPVFTASYSGFVNGDNSSSLAVQPTFTTTAATTSPVGNYVITTSGAANPNYTISYVAANISVIPAALTITADNKTKVYGDADPALTYSVTGLVGSDAVTGSLVRTPGNNAGTYAIQQGSLSASSNYVISYQGASFTITPKPVTVAADAQTKIYGQPDPLFTYSISPVLLNGDVLNGTLSRTAGENAGSYAINQGSLNHPNYALSFTGNALTINKAAQQITWVQTLVAGCDGSTSITLSATASSGLPVSYQSANTAVAATNGAQLQIAGPGSSMIIATQPGNNNYLPAAEVQQELLSKLPAHLLVKRWDDVLVFDNSSNQYTAWQWYKNGVAINGATGQYYYESGKLNGDYYAVVKTAAGVTMQTCPVTITAGATFVPISIFPNPAAPGQTITVKTGYSAAQLQGATIVVTNMLGAVVQTVQNVTPQTTITMPFAQGLYAIRLKLANGVTASVNALVKP